jgi:hypothetical protein
MRAATARDHIRLIEAAGKAVWSDEGRKSLTRARRSASPSTGAKTSTPSACSSRSPTTTRSTTPTRRYEQAAVLAILRRIRHGRIEVTDERGERRIGVVQQLLAKPGYRASRLNMRLDTASRTKAGPRAASLAG